MARAGYHVRVELRNYNPHADRDERDRELKLLLSLFKRQVNDNGCLKRWKEYQYFESKSERRRRRKKEAELERQKNKLRDYFPQQ